MADPQTSNLGFYIPTRGSDAGTWDLPVNANSSALDSMFSNVATLSLTNANVTLNAPPNSGSAWAGPYQSQSSVIKLTGVISANITITIPRAGYFIFWNLCTIASGALAGGTNTAFSIKLGSASPGKYIGVPPGEMCHVFCDGTDMNYVNMGRVGSAMDLHGVSAVPTWISVCTFLPFLVKDGTNYTNAAFPALGAFLGATFGGSAGVNFNVPDERARCRVGIDPGNATHRLTVDVNGGTMGSAGGADSESIGFDELPGYGLLITAGQGAHSHTDTALRSVSSGGAGSGNLLGTNQTLSTSTATLPAMGTNPIGSGDDNLETLQPTIVSFLPLIKT